MPYPLHSSPSPVSSCSSYESETTLLYKIYFTLSAEVGYCATRRRSAGTYFKRQHALHADEQAKRLLPCRSDSPITLHCWHVWIMMNVSRGASCFEHAIPSQSPMVRIRWKFPTCTAGALRYYSDPANLMSHSIITITMIMMIMIIITINNSSHINSNVLSPLGYPPRKQNLYLWKIVPKASAKEINVSSKRLR